MVSKFSFTIKNRLGKLKISLNQTQTLRPNGILSTILVVESSQVSSYHHNQPTIVIRCTHHDVQDRERREGSEEERRRRMQQSNSSNHLRRFRPLPKPFSPTKTLHHEHTGRCARPWLVATSSPRELRARYSEWPQNRQMMEYWSSSCKTLVSFRFLFFTSFVKNL